MRSRVTLVGAQTCSTHTDASVQVFLILGWILLLLTLTPFVLLTVIHQKYTGRLICSSQEQLWGLLTKAHDVNIVAVPRNFPTREGCGFGRSMDAIFQNKGILEILKNTCSYWHIHLTLINKDRGNALSDSELCVSSPLAVLCWMNDWYL